MALISQIVLGSLVLPDRAAAGPMVALRAAMVLCESGPPPRMTPAHHRQRQPTRAMTCSLDAALELPAVILIPAVIVPPPSLPVAGRMIALPPARGPPAVIIWALRARGPPNLV